MESVREQPNLERIVQRILEIIARIRDVPIAEVGRESTMKELGFDSLDGINLAFELEEEFGVEIPDEVLREVRDIPQIIEMVRRLAPETAE